MNIIALDIARITGIAIIKDDKITSWTIELPSKWGGIKVSQSETFLSFYKQLGMIFDSMKIDAIAFEDLAINAHSVRYMSGDWIRLYCGLRAILLMHAEHRKISWIPITVQQIKKRATGNGNAKKDTVFSAAQATWPEDPPKDNNEADARWCSLVARDILAGVDE